MNADPDSDISATFVRERVRLGQFIRRRVRDQTDAEDILQDVFYDFIEAYRLPAPIEQYSAWLFQVARHRIIDLFRKKKEQPLAELGDEDDELQLDLVLPTTEDGPQASYARSVLLNALQEALDALPDNQREVFVAHELEGLSFKEMSAQWGVGVNTLLARKRYAVLALRTRLQPVYDELEM